MRHGGDIYRNQAELDYSVNINPLGTPDSVISALQEAVQCCTQYPDIKQEALKKVLAKCEGEKPETILCGNGASELFMAVVHAVRPKNVVIPVPSFSGYEYAVNACQGKTTFWKMEESENFTINSKILSVLGADVDLLYLANPNNPTGQLITIPLLEQILEQCEKKQIYIVLDECFLAFCEKAAEYRMLWEKKTFPHLIRIRAYTKTFSIPGVRLGYLICTNVKLREKISEQLPEWNLSVFAQKAGVAAAKAHGFLNRSRGMISKERAWLTEQLMQLGYQVYPSETNFILLYSEIPLYEMLLKKGILIRDCSNFRGLKEGYYRIAVKLREDNIRLIEAVRNCSSQKEEKHERAGL